MSPEDFIIGLVIAVGFFAALLLFGLIRTRRKYKQGQGLLQNPKSAKVLKIVFLIMVAVGVVIGLIGFSISFILGK